jgi:hypothetical protein
MIFDRIAAADGADDSFDYSHLFEYVRCLGAVHSPRDRRAAVYAYVHRRYLWHIIFGEPAIVDYLADFKDSVCF